MCLFDESYRDKNLSNSHSTSKQIVLGFPIPETRLFRPIKDLGTQSTHPS